MSQRIDAVATAEDRAAEAALSEAVAAHLNQAFQEYGFKYEAHVLGGHPLVVSANRLGGYPFLRCYISPNRVRAKVVGAGPGDRLVKLRRDVALISLGKFLSHHGVSLGFPRLEGAW